MVSPDPGPILVPAAAQIGASAGSDIRIEPMAGATPVRGGPSADDRRQHVGASAERPSHRKNWLFLGNDEAGSRAAVLCTIIAGAKRHRLEPLAYLRDVVLQLSVDGSREFLESLLPDRWALAHPEHVLNHRVEESHNGRFGKDLQTPRKTPLVSVRVAREVPRHPARVVVSVAYSYRRRKRLETRHLSHDADGCERRGPSGRPSDDLGACVVSVICQWTPIGFSLPVQ
jgi:hypothetical protein